MSSPSTREPRPAMPRILARWQTWTAALVLLLAVFFVKIPRSFNNHPVIGPLGDQLHVILLGLLTLMFYWKGKLTGRIGRAALAAAVAGGAIELLQIPAGRSATLKDFLLDLLGIGLAASWVLWKGRSVRYAREAFIVLLCLIPVQMYRVPFVMLAASRASESFPVVCDFEGSQDQWLWSRRTAREVEIVPVDDGPDGRTRVLRLVGEPPDHWPATVMRRFPRDWSDYTAVSLDVRCAPDAADSVRFGLRLDDFAGLKKLEYTREMYTATRTWRTVTFRFDGARVEPSGRAFDATDVDKLLIYLPRPERRAGLEIDNVRLER